jgi:hypothetical protein
VPAVDPPLSIAPLGKVDVANASELAISGVETIIALTTKPEANRPTRATPRDFIMNILSPPGSAGLVQLWMWLKYKSELLLKPGYLRKVHELASSCRESDTESTLTCTN